MASAPSTHTKIFISYSHADRTWLDRLKRHLKPLVREGQLDYWDDTHIRPGDDWKQEIRTALETAQVAVLLISADFFASDFIDENELPPLLVAAQAKGVRILPVIISASRFARHPDLRRFQAANSPDRPLAEMPKGEQERILDNLAQTIEHAITAHKTDQGETERSLSITSTRERTYETDAAWVPKGTSFYTAGLAWLTLDSPQQGNDPNVTWYVRARLRLGTAEHERKDRPTVYIALRDAFLSVQASGYRVVNRSLIGERQSHRNFRPKIDGVEVIGPRLNGDGCLSGDPLGEDFIAQVEATSGSVEEESLTVSLYAFKRSFAVSLNAAPRLNDETVPDAEEKDAVINALIIKGWRNKDRQGRVLLARDIHIRMRKLQP